MEPVHFDLHGSAKEFDSIQLLPRRALILFAIGLGMVIVASGVGVALTIPQTVGLGSIVVIVIIGASVSVVGAVYYPKASRAAIELVVSDEGVRLLRMDEKWFGIRWDDYRNHILIVDARALPPERKVPALRSVQYVFNAVGLPVQGPISEEAVRAIISSARSRGHGITGWSELPTGLGREVDIEIS